MCAQLDCALQHWYHSPLINKSSQAVHTSECGCGGDVTCTALYWRATYFYFFLTSWKDFFFQDLLFIYSFLFLFHTGSSFKNPRSSRHQPDTSWGWQQLRWWGAESESAATGDGENIGDDQADAVFFVFAHSSLQIHPTEFWISMLQTPSASSKKSAPTTPVKPAATASADKLVRPFACATAAPDASSDTTDISQEVRLINIVSQTQLH